MWPDIITRLKDQLVRKARRRNGRWGAGKTLVFSMLTDGFNPEMLKRGWTMEVLDLVLEWTGFRIRILTKNAVVGNPRWIDYFQRNPDRFVVGLSTGTIDDEWARQVEIGTSLPPASLLLRLGSHGLKRFLCGEKYT